jgi:hypothetical protein
MVLVREQKLVQKHGLAFPVTPEPVVFHISFEHNEALGGIEPLGLSQSVRQVSLISESWLHPARPRYLLLERSRFHNLIGPLPAS